jgi:hypothetical protein
MKKAIDNFQSGRSNVLFGLLMNWHFRPTGDRGNSVQLFQQAGIRGFNVSTL